MATEAQIIANRHNAQKSTWPPNKPPISPNLPTIYNLFMQNEPNFRKSQVNVRPLVIMNYEEKSDWTLGENEPKTNPIKANLHFTAENTEYAEKKDISVSDCSIEKYALYPISPCSLRTRRLMKNKANRRPLAGNPKLEILSTYVKTTADKNPKQIRMNEIQRYKTRFLSPDN